MSEVTVNDIDLINLGNELFKDSVPSSEMIRDAMTQVLNELSGDDRELRGRLIGRMVANVRVLYDAKKRVRENKKREEEAEKNLGLAQKSDEIEMKTDEERKKMETDEKEKKKKKKKMEEEIYEDDDDSAIFPV